MAVSSKNVKFLSVTQESFGTAKSKDEQMSQARSFLSTRMHARRRAAMGVEGRNLTAQKIRNPRVINSKSKSRPISSAIEVIEARTFHQEAILSEPEDTGLLFPRATDILQPPEEFHSSQLTITGRICVSRDANLADEMQEEHSNSDPNNTPIEVQQDERGDPDRRWQYSTMLDPKPTFASQSTQSKIIEIQSTLDPFLRLPIEASSGEKALIQFCR